MAERLRGRINPEHRDSVRIDLYYGIEVRFKTDKLSVVFDHEQAKNGIKRNGFHTRVPQSQYYFFDVMPGKRLPLALAFFPEETVVHVAESLRAFSYDDKLTPQQVDLLNSGVEKLENLLETQFGPKDKQAA